MGVNWIVQIILATSKDVFIKNSCTSNVGLLKLPSEGIEFTLDDHRWKTLHGGKSYEVQHCGVPWQGSGAISFSFDKVKGYELYVKNDVAQLENMEDSSDVTADAKMGSNVTITLKDGSDGRVKLDID